MIAQVSEMILSSVHEVYIEPVFSHKKVTACQMFRIPYYLVLSSYWSCNMCIEVSPIRSHHNSLAIVKKNKTVGILMCIITFEYSSENWRSVAQLLGSRFVWNEARSTTDVHGILLHFTEHFPYLTNQSKHISEPVT